MRQTTAPVSGEIRTFTIGAATEWMEWSGVALADVANEDDDHDMKLGAIGFTRAPRGRTQPERRGDDDEGQLHRG